jgi:hypothetical protein
MINTTTPQMHSINRWHFILIPAVFFGLFVIV